MWQPFLFSFRLDLDKWINEPLSEDDEDIDDGEDVKPFFSDDRRLEIM